MSSPSPLTTPVSSSSSPVPPHTLGRWFAAIRRDGFLALLDPEEWQTLSALLSFTRRDGRRVFTVEQLAVAIGQSPETARTRLEQLARVQWRDAPLAALERDPEGEIVGATLAPVETLSGERAPLPPEAEAVLSGPASLPTPAATDALPLQLREVGLNPEQVAWLLRSFPPGRIQQQLEWLPSRQARNPAALLIRAVEGDWGPPREAA
jgi:hypothetical protein